MYRSIRNFNIPPPGIPREFDFKSSPGRREFDVLSLPCGGAFDKGGEFEPEVLKFARFRVLPACTENTSHWRQIQFSQISRETASIL